MRNRRFTAALAICIVLLPSCIKEKLEVTYNKQEEQIDKYISQKDTLAIVRNSGANRIIIKQGEGEGLAKDGYVSFYYAGYAFNGSVSASNLFTTNRIATAQEANWNIEDIDVELYEISLKDAELIPGLKYGLEGVKPGEECEILFSAKYGFGNKALGIIPAKTALLYKIWVVGVTND
jgi:FKBP-type peptidyl-prolyl cis-trans isomerase